ncbi:hypothetical protein FQR65_LT03548 [Abscondita terminalis]|nr:hypothetical protein FQR65_LT03548 [Abscondita terminalis]
MKFYALILFGIATTVNCDVLLQTFIDGNRRFSADVYKEIKANQTGNFLFCPLSAEIILALTRMGAKGATGTQLSQGLHLPDDTNQIQEIFKQLTPKLKSTSAYTLNSANRIYLNNGYKIREDFKNIAQESFSADVKNIDFKAKEAAAGEINQWVSEQTFNKINDLIDPKMISQDTKTVLVNALYFKGSWGTTFNEKATKTKSFFLNNNEQVDVDMMEMTDYFRYDDNEQLQAKILEMPYVGNEYSMVIVLPNHKEGLANLENQMDKVLTATTEYQVKVHLQLPKFKVESEIALTDILKKLGVKDAFEDYADLSGFSAPGEQPLKISDVVQKAIVEVDEKGTVAAAATAVFVIATYSMIQPPVYEFNANHPFIYYIKGPEGIMFVGRYVKK